MAADSTQISAHDWVSFPGGELEGRRPKALCPGCRAALKRQAAAGAGADRTSRRTLCFQCYRADLDRQHALAAAGSIDTASQERFQYQLPFEPLNAGRLAVLKVERAAARGSAQTGTVLEHGGRFEARRRCAQIAARQVLQQSLRTPARTPADAAAVVAALHAAELQLPESWWPFVMSR